MKLFVTGASGFVGSAVVSELLGAGHEVAGLARNADSARRLTQLGVEPISGSLADLDALSTAANEANGVIHLAFRHGDPVQDATESDRLAIEALGTGLGGTGRPLVVTSGTLVLAPGRIGFEADSPDPAAPAASRAIGERAARNLTERNVRVSVVRLAPSVHDRVKRGFVGALIDAARRSGISGYVGDGSQRWPAVNRQDAAHLFRLAVETAPPGSVLHGVDDEGVTLRSIAEVIAAKMEVPVQQVPKERATEHFGWIAPLAATDAPASSAATRSLLGWVPSHSNLIDDLQQGDFFVDVSGPAKAG